MASKTGMTVHCLPASLAAAQEAGTGVEPCPGVADALIPWGNWAPISDSVPEASPSLLGAHLAGELALRVGRAHIPGVPTADAAPDVSALLGTSGPGVPRVGLDPTECLPGGGGSGGPKDVGAALEDEGEGAAAAEWVAGSWLGLSAETLPKGRRNGGERTERAGGKQAAPFLPRRWPLDVQARHEYGNAAKKHRTFVPSLAVEGLSLPTCVRSGSPVGNADAALMWRPVGEKWPVAPPSQSHQLPAACQRPVLGEGGLSGRVETFPEAQLVPHPPTKEDGPEEGGPGKLPLGFAVPTRTLVHGSERGLPGDRGELCLIPSQGSWLPPHGPCGVPVATLGPAAALPPGADLGLKLCFSRKLRTTLGLPDLNTGIPTSQPGPRAAGPAGLKSEFPLFCDSNEAARSSHSLHGPFLWRPQGLGFQQGSPQAALDPEFGSSGGGGSVREARVPGDGSRVFLSNTRGELCQAGREDHRDQGSFQGLGGNFQCSSWGHDLSAVLWLERDRGGEAHLSSANRSVCGSASAGSATGGEEGEEADTLGGGLEEPGAESCPVAPCDKEYPREPSGGGEMVVRANGGAGGCGVACVGPLHPSAPSREVAPVVKKRGSLALHWGGMPPVGLRWWDEGGWSPVPSWGAQAAQKQGVLLSPGESSANLALSLFPKYGDVKDVPPAASAGTSSTPVSSLQGARSSAVVAVPSAVELRNALCVGDDVALSRAPILLTEMENAWGRDEMWMSAPGDLD